MNLAVAQLLGQYPKLLELGDMVGIKANQLTPTHLQRVAAAFNVALPFTDELVAAFVDLLKGKDVNSVADAIQSPDSIRDIVLFFKGGYHELVALRKQMEADSQPDDAIAFDADAESLFIGAS